MSFFNPFPTKCEKKWICLQKFFLNYFVMKTCYSKVFLWYAYAHTSSARLITVNPIFQSHTRKPALWEVAESIKNKRTPLRFYRWTTDCSFWKKRGQSLGTPKPYHIIPLIDTPDPTLVTSFTTLAYFLGHFFIRFKYVSDVRCTISSVARGVAVGHLHPQAKVDLYQI